MHYLQKTATGRTFERVCGQNMGGGLKNAAEYRLAFKTDSFREVTIEVNLQQEINNAKYLSKCYRNFAAVKRPSTDSDRSQQMSKTMQTRRDSVMPSSSTEGLLKGVCIFAVRRVKPSTARWNRCQIVSRKTVAKAYMKQPQNPTMRE